MTASVASRISLALAIGLGGGAAHAESIERACLKSDRDAASRALCGCIQQVADMTLRPADQRRAASFFQDPEKAENARAADSATATAFWERYAAFGQQAEVFCAPADTSVDTSAETPSG